MKAKILRKSGFNKSFVKSMKKTMKRLNWIQRTQLYKELKERINEIQKKH